MHPIQVTSALDAAEQLKVTTWAFMTPSLKFLNDKRTLASNKFANRHVKFVKYFPIISFYTVMLWLEQADKVEDKT